MEGRPFHPRFEDLPLILPIFPLPGALLLPGGRLPLNVFEPRYLALIQDSLGWSRLIGMIQPVETSGDETHPPLYDTGCAGRVCAFSETDDGRLLITLAGICRFHVAEELEGIRGYRRIAADWAPFRGDLDEPAAFALPRTRLMTALAGFLKLHSIDLNVKAIETASDAALLVSLPMALPFEPREKQALLECPTPASRAGTLIALMEMAVAEGRAGGKATRQ